MRTLRLTQTTVRPGLYLEDYLQFPEDPAPKIAARIEGRMREIGVNLFEQVLEANRGTRRLWDKMADGLADTRVEIRTGVLEAATIPWELLRDPLTGVPRPADQAL